LSDGTIRTPQARVGTASAFGQLTVVPNAASTIGAVIRGVASQTANLQEWQSSAGSVVARVTSAGNIASAIFGSLTAGHSYIQTAGTNNAIQIQTNAASNVGLRVIGAASQSGNLQEWSSSSGTVLARVNSSGQFVGDGSQLTGISAGANEIMVIMGAY
jgi:hypothetical protein